MEPDFKMFTPDETTISIKPSGMICCVTDGQRTVFAQSSSDGPNLKLTACVLPTPCPHENHGVSDRSSPQQVLSAFRGTRASSTIPMEWCEIQRVSIQGPMSSSTHAHLHSLFANQMSWTESLFKSSFLELSAKRSGSPLIGFGVLDSTIQSSPRQIVLAGLTTAHLDIEEFACIRGLHVHNILGGNVDSSLFVRTSKNHILLAMISPNCELLMLRKVPYDSDPATSPTNSVVSKVVHEIELLLISAGQQSLLHNCRLTAYISSSNTDACGASRDVIDRISIPGFSIDEIQLNHPWCTQLIVDHNLDPYHALVMLGLLHTDHLEVAS